MLGSLYYITGYHMTSLERLAQLSVNKNISLTENCVLRVLLHKCFCLLVLECLFTMYCNMLYGISLFIFCLVG